jgi:drug/metabolite transporter (DMT)-like permease
MNDIITVALGGVVFASTLALWNTSLLLTTAATATLLSNCAPLWVGLVSYLLFHERLSKSYWVGLGIAMLGMMWLIGAEAYEQLHLNAGNLLALGSSLTYAVYFLIAQKTRSKVDLITFMAITLFSSVVVLFIFNIAIGTKLTGYPNQVWMALIGLGLVSQLGGWLGINYALGHMRAARVSVCTLSESVATGIAAMIFLKEYLHLNQIIGGTIILIGIYFVTMQSSATGTTVKSK